MGAAASRSPQQAAGSKMVHNPAQDVKAAFAEIEEKFKWDSKITKWILDEGGLGATSVDDFIYAISGPEDISKIITAAVPTNALLMTSRVRQAWRV